MFPRAEPPMWWPGTPGAALLWTLFRIVIALPLFVVLLLMIVLLPISRLVVFYPLALGSVASLCVAIYFGTHRAWLDMAAALLVWVCATIALRAYLAIAEWIDPEFGRRREPDPWFWC